MGSFIKEILKKCNIIKKNDIVNVNIVYIKGQIDTKINNQIGKLGLEKLEKEAWNRIVNLRIKNVNINKIRTKIKGIIPLLRDGELMIALLSDVSNEEYISSACLQPFCNATEIMLYICFILLAGDNELKYFIKTESGEYTNKTNLKKLIESIPKETLESVLDEYRHFRNNISHEYQLIPIEAAYSFIQRTYESIQRLELLITQN